MVTPNQSSRVDYDTDTVKHYVRFYGWLPAAQYRASRVSRRELKYLTFCAASAVDVFMLEKNGQVTRDPDSLRLNGVFFCESELEDFQAISSLIGGGEQGFLGRFEDIVLFQESDRTRDRNLADLSAEPRDSITRHLLHLKEAHGRLRASFPFDLINLDISGAVFPPYDPPASRMFTAVRKVLDWQDSPGQSGRPINEFTLLLTARVSTEDANEEAINQLETLIVQNIANYEPYREKFQEKFGDIGPDDLRNAEFPDFFAISFSKLVLNEAMMRRWDLEYRNVFLYQRLPTREGGDSYHMVSLVSHLKRIGQKPDQVVGPGGAFPEALRARYIEESTETLHFSPSYIEIDKLPDEELRDLNDDLSSIIQYREHFRGSLKQE